MPGGFGGGSGRGGYQNVDEPATPTPNVSKPPAAPAPAPQPQGQSAGAYQTV